MFCFSIGTHVYSTEDSPAPTDEELTSPPQQHGAMTPVGSPKLGSAMVNCTGTRAQIPDGTLVNASAAIATSQLNQIFDITAREKKTRQQSEYLNRQRRRLQQRHRNSSCCTGYLEPTVATAFITEGNPSTESSLCVTSYTTSKNTSRTCTDMSDRCYGANSLPVQLPPLVPKLLKKSMSVDQLSHSKTLYQKRNRRTSLPQIHHLGGLTTQNSSTVLSRQQHDLMIIGMRWLKH